MSSAPHKRCLGCGYDLRGLPENRCPECGRPFDPDDPESYVSKLRSGRSYLVAAIGGLVALAVPLTAAKLVDLEAIRSSVALLLLAPFMVGGLAAEAIVLDASVRALRRPPGLVQYRKAIVAALLISLIVVLGFVAALLIPSKSSH